MSFHSNFLHFKTRPLIKRAANECEKYFASSPCRGPVISIYRMNLDRKRSEMEKRRITGVKRGGMTRWKQQHQWTESITRRSSSFCRGLPCKMTRRRNEAERQTLLHYLMRRARIVSLVSIARRILRCTSEAISLLICKICARRSVTGAFASAPFVFRNRYWPRRTDPRFLPFKTGKSRIM